MTVRSWAQWIFFWLPQPPPTSSARAKYLMRMYAYLCTQMIKHHFLHKIYKNRKSKYCTYIKIIYMKDRSKSLTDFDHATKLNIQIEFLGFFVSHFVKFYILFSGNLMTSNICSCCSVPIFVLLFFGFFFCFHFFLTRLQSLIHSYTH